jgi:hypothetical protein
MQKTSFTAKDVGRRQFDEPPELLTLNLFLRPTRGADLSKNGYNNDSEA